MVSSKNIWGKIAAFLTVVMVATALAACGNGETTTIVPATTGTSATTAVATTAAATAAATSAASVTTAAPTTVSTTNAAVTTARATTAASNIPRPTIGNTYPAGPAPTPAPPQGGLVEVTLNVPQSLKTGRWAQERKLQLPRGFEISLYSVHNSTVRLGTISPDERLFVAERQSGRVMWLRDNNGVGEPQIFAEGLNGPHSVVFHAINGQMYLWVAENDKVSRYAYQNGQARGDNKEVIVKNVPTGGGHTTRTIAFGPDGKLYLAAGSTCNVCEESDARQAAITVYNADGTGERVFARGLRNEVGILFHPETGEMWGTENSRDNIGNDIPPEEINIIVDGGDYGWPYCYGNGVYDQNYNKKNADYCKQTINPALPMQAHSAPLGLDFYFPKNMQFPTDFRGDAFVAFHGSWNRNPPTGYKVVRVRVKDGRPVSYEDFATGWLETGRWGRPVAPIVAPDGSLYITDDGANAIYKVTYKGT
jgi:glucose/arabinose dehydrogenase